MNAEKLDQIVHAVLYEGYILYPYRASSKKNRRERFTFGRIYPEDYSEAQKGAEACLFQTECLVQTKGEAPTVEITVRFLQPMWREVGYLSAAEEDGVETEDLFEAVPEMVVGEQFYQSWQEATQRDVKVVVGPLGAETKQTSTPFLFAASRVFEPLPSADEAVRIAQLRRQEAVEGLIEIETVLVREGVFKLTVKVFNHTPITAAQCENGDEVIMRTFASTHTILQVTDGEFISLLEPAAEFKELAEGCKNIGTWPVLVGEEKLGGRDTMLSSPIILYDYPQIAPESVGGFFDGTEMDEMLTLRVLTMTDSEKVEMRQVDDFARRILERTETAGAENLLKMHGIMREVKGVEEFFNPTKAMEKVFVGGQELKVGGKVRIHPKRRADAFDMMLAGKVGIIEAIEQDAEEQVHLALVLEDDPGRDLGMQRQTAHRFFYTLDEVEPLTEEPA